MVYTGAVVRRGRRNGWEAKSQRRVWKEEGRAGRGGKTGEAEVNEGQCDL